MSRWDTVELGRRATAQAAADVLDRLAERMPFPVRAISIDNGSEFMAEFEAACATRGIRLFVLPPRSPKLHGPVEPANRTHTEEFYELTDAEPGRAHDRQLQETDDRRARAPIALVLVIAWAGRAGAGHPRAPARQRGEEFLHSG